AIFVSPTNKQVEELKQKHGEDFYTIADDNLWYQNEAFELLDSMQISIVNFDKEATHLKLINLDSNEWILNLRQKDAPSWNIILFDNSKTPKIVSSIDVNEELILEYFKL